MPTRIARFLALLLVSPASSFSLPGLAHSCPSHGGLTHSWRPRAGPVYAAYKNGDEMTKESLIADFGGCLSNEPLGWKGALLATAGTYLWYLGTNTNTNKQRELVEGPGVRRRNILLVVILQVGAANFRSGTGRVCTDEERKEQVKTKLQRKGFDTDKLSF